MAALGAPEHLKFKIQHFQTDTLAQPTDSRILKHLSRITSCWIVSASLSLSCRSLSTIFSTENNFIIRMQKKNTAQPFN